MLKAKEYAEKLEALCTGLGLENIAELVETVSPEMFYEIGSAIVTERINAFSQNQAILQDLLQVIRNNYTKEELTNSQ